MGLGGIASPVRHGGRCARLLVLLAMCVAAAGCARPGPGPAGPQAVAAAFSAPYQLDSGDQVRVTVFGQSDLSRVYPIDAAGTVSMPLIGAVRARGRTPGQLETTIATALAARYLRNPDVSVEVQSYRPFFILGEVQRAGQYPYVAEMTVSNAVAIAGGYTYRADQGPVTVTRKIAGVLYKGLATPDQAIMPGDTVTVHERFF